MEFNVIVTNEPDSKLIKLVTELQELDG